MAAWSPTTGCSGNTTAWLVELPDSKAAAALSLVVTGSGAFTTFETHELIEASDLAQIAERAKRINYEPPGT